MTRLALAILIALVTAASAQTLLGVTTSPTGGGTPIPPAGCANQLVLDYSNSCALIAQAWGQ